MVVWSCGRVVVWSCGRVVQMTVLSLGSPVLSLHIRGHWRWKEPPPYVVKSGLHWYLVGRVAELVDGTVLDNSASPCTKDVSMSNHDTCVERGVRQLRRVGPDRI